MVEQGARDWSDDIAQPCPVCGGRRVHRTVARMSYRIEGVGTQWYHAGYYTCLDCWHRWDGITDPPGLTLPAGVIAREEARRDQVG